MIPQIHTAVGILRREGKVLVTSRPEGKSYSGYWEFPGGKLEAGESGFVALRRELQEEIGIIVKNADFCFEHVHAYPERQVTIEVWSVTEYEGEPSGLENQQLAWLTWCELPTIRLLEANYALVRRLAADSAK